MQFRSGHQFRVPVDPYVTPGNPSSGLLAGIAPDPAGTTGEGDHRIQAYNFRVCLTRAADRLPFPKPAGYDPARYELLLRYIQAGVWDVLGNNQPMPNGKTDWNNNGAVSSDNIGRNYDWPDADYCDRERIFQDHVTYQQGLMWFLANDPRVPAAIRAEVGAWGLPRDEFAETGGWPHELYVREARRMVSDYVMTEHDCRGAAVAEDPVGLASYTMDSHNCQRVVVGGKARNEGDVQVPVPAPYPVSYRSIVPRAGECENLLVPVCLSASHIAYGSIRMEPVFMVLGQAAATAASLAIDDGRGGAGRRLPGAAPAAAARPRRARVAASAARPDRRGAGAAPRLARHGGGHPGQRRRRRLRGRRAVVDAARGRSRRCRRRRTGSSPASRPRRPGR